MTVVADEKGNVTLPMAAPGDRFEVELQGEGKVLLTKVAAHGVQKTNRVTFVRKNGHLVGMTERGFDEAELAKALREFP